MGSRHWGHASLCGTRSSPQVRVAQRRADLWHTSSTMSPAHRMRSSYRPMKGAVPSCALSSVCAAAREVAGREGFGGRKD